MSREANPFHYGSPATGEFFVDRDDEILDITDRMRNGQNIVLLSPRRYGKTSLLKMSMQRAQERGVHTGYATLLQCSSPKDVTDTLLDAVLRGPRSWLSRQHERLATLLGRLRASVKFEVDPSGSLHASISPALAAGDWRSTIQDVLRLLSHASEGNRPVALVMDEFQRVAEIDESLPSLFKELADELVRVSLVFSGSKLHTMRRLAIGPGAPLLDMGERISLGVISPGVMCPFLIERCAASDVKLSPDAARLVYDLVDGVPNDVQRLAYEAFLLADDAVDVALVHAALGRVVGHRAIDYEELFSTLAPSQQRVLRALSRGPVEAVYSKQFLDLVEVANSNAVRTALTALEQRELVVRHGKAWTVADAFLREWLREPDRG